MRKTIFASLAFALIGCQGVHTDPTMNQQNPADSSYPAGPFGYAVGSIIQNIQFTGKVDPNGAAGTASYDTLAMAPLSLADYHKDPAVKFIVMSGVAGWCVPCNNEQANVPSLATTYESKGVRFLEAMIEGYKRGTASTEVDLNHWQANHSLHVGLALDPTDAIHQYADIAAFPLNMVVSTSDMKIVHMQVGQEDLGTVLSSLVP